MTLARIACAAERVRLALEMAAEDCITVAGPHAYAAGVQALHDLLEAVDAHHDIASGHHRPLPAAEPQASAATMAGSNERTSTHATTPP